MLKISEFINPKKTDFIKWLNDNHNFEKNLEKIIKYK